MNLLFASDFGETSIYNTWVIYLMCLAIIVNLIGFLLIISTLRQNRKQKQADIFLEYTKRYHEICGDNFTLINNFPHLESATKKQRDLYIAFLPKFISIIHQEHFLYKQKLLDKSIWKLWSGYLKNNITTKEMKEFWYFEKKRIPEDTEFFKMIDRLITEDEKRNV